MSHRTWILSLLLLLVTALQLLTKAARLAPNSYQCNNNLGNVLEEAGHLEEAERILAKLPWC